MTGGLINNVEMATFLRGEMREETIALVFEWARDIWRSNASIPWEPSGPVVEDSIPDELFRMLQQAVAEDPVFYTLGRPAPNRIVELTPQLVWVETERSKERGKPEVVPAWMIETAW